MTSALALYTFASAEHVLFERTGEKQDISYSHMTHNPGYNKKGFWVVINRELLETRRHILWGFPEMIFACENAVKRSNPLFLELTLFIPLFQVSARLQYTLAR